MLRGLDHIVHLVRDLDAAGADYERLGFTVGARNRHPWGTHNRIVQFAHFFIELLSVVEEEKILAARPRAPSFGALARDLLAQGEGFAMLALESRDAHADAQAFRASNIGDFAVFDFARETRRSDGRAAEVAFSLAFASDPQPAQAAFFSCQQHFPGNFWDAALQQHANGALGVAGVVLVAENPADHYIFLSAFVGERELDATSTGITVHTPRGDIQVMDPAAFRMRHGLEPPPSQAGARIAALRLAVTSLTQARAVLADRGIEAREQMGRLFVAPAHAHGATIVFEHAQQMPRGG